MNQQPPSILCSPSAAVIAPAAVTAATDAAADDATAADCKSTYLPTQTSNLLLYVLLLF